MKKCFVPKVLIAVGITGSFRRSLRARCEFCFVQPNYPKAQCCQFDRRGPLLTVVLLFLGTGGVTACPAATAVFERTRTGD